MKLPIQTFPFRSSRPKGFPSWSVKRKGGTGRGSMGAAVEDPAAPSPGPGGAPRSTAVHTTMARAVAMSTPRAALARGAAGRFLPSLACGSMSVDVEGEEEEHPDDDDEVPVEAGELDPEVGVAVVLPLEAAGEDAREEDQAAQHVEPVERAEHVEDAPVDGTQREVGAQLQELVDLGAEERRPEGDRERQVDAEPDGVLAA